MHFSRLHALHSTFSPLDIISASFKQSSGCETWSLTVRDDHIQRMLENRVLCTTYSPKRDRGNSGAKKLHKEELYDLDSSPTTRVVPKVMSNNFFVK